jgi:hypothetical protein
MALAVIVSAIGLLVVAAAGGADVPTAAAGAVVVVAAGLSSGPWPVRAAIGTAAVACAAATIVVDPLWAALVVPIIALAWLVRSGSSRLSAWAGPIVPS